MERFLDYLDIAEHRILKLMALHLKGITSQYLREMCLDWEYKYEVVQRITSFCHLSQIRYSSIFRWIPVLFHSSDRWIPISSSCFSKVPSGRTYLVGSINRWVYHLLLVHWRLPLQYLEEHTRVPSKFTFSRLFYIK